MANKFGKGKEYSSVKEVLDMLRFDKDSDEENFAEPEPKLQEQESNRQNDGQELEDRDTELSSLPTNEDLQRPSVPQQSYVFSREGKIWNREPPCTTGRQGKRNVISMKPGTELFILARVNDEKDVFQELWGHQILENIMHFILAKARRQGDGKFS